MAHEPPPCIPVAVLEDLRVRMPPLPSDVNVVIPAPPGFPFELPEPEGGACAIEMAMWAADAMAGLGEGHP